MCQQPPPEIHWAPFLLLYYLEWIFFFFILLAKYLLPVWLFFKKWFYPEEKYSSKSDTLQHRQDKGHGSPPLLIFHLSHRFFLNMWPFQDSLMLVIKQSFETVYTTKSKSNKVSNLLFSLAVIRKQILYVSLESSTQLFYL